MTGQISSARKVRILRRLVEEQGGRCCYCARLMGPIYGKKRVETLEHLIPIALGGSHRYENLAAACLKCNSERGVRLGVELNRFRKLMKFVNAMNGGPMVKASIMLAGLVLLYASCLEESQR